MVSARLFPTRGETRTEEKVLVLQCKGTCGDALGRLARTYSAIDRLKRTQMEKRAKRKGENVGRNPHSEARAKIITLSVKIGNLIGRPVRPPSSAGELRNELGELFQWRKCPKHGTWMQPEWKPFKHWRCGVIGKTKEVKDTFGHSRGFAWFNERCEFTRAAKLRTLIERRIFALAWALDQL